MEGINYMKDIEFKTENEKFKYRVNGLVIRNGKLLTLLMKNKTSYCLPGGHVELGEDSRSAMMREMQEEIEASITIDKELAIVENFSVKIPFSKNSVLIINYCDSYQYMLHTLLCISAFSD